MKEVKKRQASRLVLLDSAKRLLLFRHAWKNGGTFWALPGGGVEKGETFEQAAIREAAEELGVTGGSLNFLWEKVVSMAPSICQQERYFLMKGDFPNLLSYAHVGKIHEKEGILETKWWTLKDLESITEPLFPEGLALEIKKISIESLPQ
jgi:ADP-ribose pyrophosphatase YjhB (NUDIX family)